MKIRVGTVVKILIVLVIAVIAGGVAILKSIDLNEYRPLIAQKVEEATGRKLTLAGDIYLEIFTLTPSIAIDDVSFANAGWGSQPEMATLKRLEVQVAILPLLDKKLEVQRFVLVDPKILLETDAKGQGNWQFQPAGAAPAPSEGGGPAMAGQFTVHDLEIENGSLTYRDGKTKKETTIGLKDFSASAESASSPLKFSMEGDFNKAPFEAAGTIGSLADIQSPKQPFPVDVTAKAGGANVKLTGSIANPAAAQGLDLDLSVEGKTLADLAVFAPGVPDLGPYSLSGHVGDSKGDINVTKLAAKLGNTDLAGNVTLVKADKPTVRADLTSNVVDLVQLQEAAATAKGGGGGEAAAPAAAPAPGGKLFSSAPLPLDGLKAANADVKLNAKKLVIKGPEVTNVNVALTLTNGKLTVKPLTMDVLGGNISADTSLDAGAAKPALAVNANVKELDLATLVKQMKINQKLSGKLNFEGDVAGAGASVAQIMAGLNGKTHLWLNDARLDNTLLKIVMADLAKAVVGSGEASKISCLVSRFDIVNGLATSKQLVMDTESVTIYGKGTVNLASEQLDLYLDPSPKAAAVVDLAIPVSITGPLSKPNVTPDALAAAKKVGGALGGVVTGGAIGGVAGGLLDKVTGGGKESEAAAPQAAGGDPCAMGAVAAPAKATAPATAPSAGPAEAETPAAQPEKPSGPLAPVEDLGKDVGKTLKGIFE